MVRIKFKRRALGTVNFLGRPSTFKRSKPLRFKTKHTSPSFASFTNIPKPTSVSIFAHSMNKPALKFYGDSDGDGVMNGFDCAPNNKRLQGPQHKKYPGARRKQKGETQSEYLGRIKQPRWSDFEKAGIQVNEGPTWDERKREEESRRHLEAEARADAMGDKFIFNPTLTDNENDEIADLVTRRNKMAKESEDALANRSDPDKLWTKELKRKESKKDKEPTYEDIHELTATPNEDGYDYDSQDED